jgi:hypothetical protein
MRSPLAGPCHDLPSSSLDEVSLDICVCTALFVFLLSRPFSAADTERVTVLLGGVAERLCALKGVNCEEIDVSAKPLLIGENGGSATGEVGSFLCGESLLRGDNNFLRSTREALRAMS